MADPERPVVDWLAEVIAEGDLLADRELLRGAYIRLIGSLVVGGKHERALAYYDQAVEEFGGLEYITREDILRSSTLTALGEGGLTTLGGTIRFEIPGALPGDTLLVTPDVDAPVDGPYLEAGDASSGRVRIDRRIGTWPQRWVLRNDRGEAVGSGGVWPAPESDVEVRVERRDQISDAVVDEVLGDRRPADGTRRVFQVILDCADWRIIQYGRARGELPFFGRMIEEGRRAVLESIPPFTAVAITKLVYPNKQGTRSVIDLLHQLGAEIQGLNFVGVNPFEPLEWVLPKEGQLFETIADGGFSTVNLLRSEGSLQVGRQAEVLGPGDRSQQLPGYKGSRPLDDDERELLGPLEGTSGHLIEEMAADFDVLEQLAEGDPIDFVALRVASLDLMTHGSFQTMNQTGRDDGDALMYRVYRYMDHRLGRLDGLLDQDDILIVMSDHGIRTPMEHDRHAVFLVSGRGIEPGRVPGTPPIREVSGWVADLLGVDTGWPGPGEGVLTTPSSAGQGPQESAQGPSDTE